MEQGVAVGLDSSAHCWHAQLAQSPLPDNPFIPALPLTRLAPSLPLALSHSLPHTHTQPLQDNFRLSQRMELAKAAAAAELGLRPSQVGVWVWWGVGWAGRGLLGAS